MSFSKILINPLRCSDSAIVNVYDDYVHIIGEDPASEIHEEYFLPGIHVYVFQKTGLVICYGAVPTASADGTFCHQSSLMKYVDRAVNIINTRCTGNGILGHILMNGTLRFEDEDIIVTHGPVEQRVMPDGSVWFEGRYQTMITPEEYKVIYNAAQVNARSFFESIMIYKK